MLILTVTTAPVTMSVDAWRMDRFGASATTPARAGDLANVDGMINVLEHATGTAPLAAELPP